MNGSRREFLKRSAALAAAGVAGSCASNKGSLEPSAEQPDRPAPPRGMSLLVLGGARFPAPSIVDAALARGYEVSVFGADAASTPFAGEVERLVGNRDDDLDALRYRSWDAVIDTDGYVPRHVRGPAELLSEYVGHYLFLSTCSVYRELGRKPVDESSALRTLEDETVEVVNGKTYGALKALCERAAEAAMPGRVTRVRPGVVVGPGDPTDRFTWWPTRVQAGGEVLAPGRPEYEIQLLDARDLADFCVRLVEKEATGTFNACGLREPVPMGELLATCREVTGSDATFTWVEESFLARHRVRPWTELPAWFPPPQGMEQVPPVSCGRAVEAGLSFRDLTRTVEDTLAFHEARGADYVLREGIGMSPGREQELLDAWHATRS